MVGVTAGVIEISGLSTVARVGDLVRLGKDLELTGLAEVVAISKNIVSASPFDARSSPSIGEIVELTRDVELRPSSEWIGRIVDAFGSPLDGKPMSKGAQVAPLRRTPPKANERRKLGHRLNTKLAVMDTILPIAKGQRIGVFAGSGVGKTTLLAQFARHVEADCIVVCLVGERGRELNEFIEKGLGDEGRKRSVVVAATSDQSSLIKRRAAWTATAIAEHFRDKGQHVLLILDSVTRFAEAHREVALMAGEIPSLRAYPPSTSNMIAALTERAGAGASNQGDITAIYSVLVAAGDMDEPVSDMTRGLLDGHIILDRAIAERGRFPAIDIRKSVSRSLPEIADDEENDLIMKVRSLVSSYETAAPLIQTGLYVSGSDPAVDQAIQFWPLIETFVKTGGLADTDASFDLLRSLFEEESSTIPVTV